MGNAWISPVDSTMTWGPFVYWMSTTDERGLEAIQKKAFECKDAIDKGQWKLATDLWGQTVMVLRQHTNGVDFYNILNFIVLTSARSNVLVTRAASVIDEVKFSLQNHMPAREYKKYFGKKAPSRLCLLMNGPIRKKLGVIPKHVTWDGMSDNVFKFHNGDFMKPVVDVVDETLNRTNLEVIVYQGQLDIICDSKAAMDWVSRLKWKNLPKYMAAKKTPLIEPNTRQTDAFVKAYEKFKFYWLLRGGHSAPKDAAFASYRMLQRIFENTDR